jgi:hypothetical protein
VKLGEVRAGREEIVVRGEADRSKGDHDALERLGDMVLVGTAARRPMGQAAALEGNHPSPHVVPDSCHTSIVCNVVVGRRTIEGIYVDVEEGAVPSKAAGEGSKVEGIDVDGGGEIWSIRRDEGSEAGIHDEVVEGSKGSVA